MPDPAPAPPSPAVESPSPAAPRRFGFLADNLSILLVLAFAFLAASFSARNTDLWLHLATGRLIAAGEYQFGHDPFADTTAGKYWANHAWLFDWAAYQTFARVGPESLVALKAGAIVLMAAVLLLASRARGPLWIAVGCVLLALLAMSPRLLLQPFAASLLLLALCLHCLRTGGRALLAVPVLIAVWVNLDAWFVLGPVLVLLFWIGRRLDANRASGPQWPWWLLPASLAAGLVSPHHVFAFQFPAEVSPWVWTSEFVNDPRFSNFFASPWRRAAVNFTSGFSPAAWGFFILLALGVVSFGINRASRRSWRLAVWLPFAALACWQIRLIPFFAVVAAPITALNFRDMVAPPELTRFGRTFVLSAATALLVFAWFGWLLGLNDHDRAAAWQVHTDPTLARTANQLAVWRQDGRLEPKERVFVTHADLAHYLAWHAPGERYSVDSRLQLFTDVAEPFLMRSQALGILPSDRPRSLTDFPPDAFTAVAYYEPDPTRLTVGLGAITAKQNRWQILTISGMVVLFVPRNDASTPPALDVEKSLLHGANDFAKAENGPAALVEPGAWWNTARERNRGRTGTWEADAGNIYLRVFQGAPTESTAWPQLSIQACRVGIERDAHDPIAWQTLGRAYLLVGNRTWHRDAAGGFTMLERVRNLQIVAALTQAVTLNPDAAADHETLAALFQQSQRFDLALRHATVAHTLVRRNVRQMPDPVAYNGMVVQAAQVQDELQRIVFEAENRFLVRTAGLTSDPVAKARIAVELGLTQKAIDVLLASHSELYGVAGLSLLADLLLQSGQITECRVLLDREELRRNPQALGLYTLPRQPNPDGNNWPYRLPAYDWFDFCQCAAAGRNVGAVAALDRMAKQFEQYEAAILPSVVRDTQTLAARELGLSVPPMPFLGRVGTVVDRSQVTVALAQTKSLGTTRADLLTVAGVLELERGNPTEAAALFKTATAVYRGAKPFAISRPGEAIALRYNEAFLRRP